MTIDKLSGCLSPNRFIPIDSEELTALEQLGKMIGKTNELVEDVNKINVELPLKLNTKDYQNDMLVNRKINENGDFTGTWFGVKSPHDLNPSLFDYDHLKSLTSDGISYSSLELIGDRFGWKSIHFIGDSITHGANCEDIELDSWCGIIKRCLAIDYQTPNHGYETIYSPIQNSNGKYTSSHYCDTVGSWSMNEDYRSISLCNMSSVESGAILKITPNTNSKYCKVLFNGVEDGGSFKVYLSNNPSIITTVNTNVGVEGVFYSNAIDLQNANGELQIMIEKTDDKLTEILGVQYYDDESKPMLQNYARSGAKLKDINSSIIPTLCNTSLAFFALGHNDQWDDDVAAFSNKINEFMNQFFKFKTKVVVLDFIWDESKTVLKNELKRLASSLDGIYIDLAPYHTQIGFMSDESHPSPYGHQVIASVVAQKLGLGVRSKGGSLLYKKPVNIGMMNDGELLYNTSYREGKKVTFNLGISQSRNNGDVVAIFPKPVSETKFLSGGEEYTILTSGMVVYNGSTKIKHELRGCYLI